MCEWQHHMDTSIDVNKSENQDHKWNGWIHIEHLVACSALFEGEPYVKASSASAAKCKTDRAETNTKPNRYRYEMYDLTPLHFLGEGEGPSLLMIMRSFAYQIPVQIRRILEYQSPSGSEPTDR